MKKSLLVTLEFPPDTGGIANYLAGLYSRLPADQVVVLTSFRGTVSSVKEPICRIYRKIFFWRFWPAWVPLMWHILHILRKENIRVLHISHILPVGYIALLFKKCARIPYVVYTHGLDIFGPLYRSRWKTFWVKYILRHANGVVANSMFTKEGVRALGVSEEKILVVYPCPSILSSSSVVDTHSLRLRYGLAGKKVLLSVGRLVERKGHAAVIDALPEIAKKISTIVYIIVGEGPCHSALMQRIQMKGLQGIVRMVGKIPDAELPSYFQIADIFVLPTKGNRGDVEGFGMVFVEAQTYGIPVIAGRSGGVPETLLDGETGKLVDPEDVNIIAEAIIDLCSHPEVAEKMGERGKEWVKEKFVWEHEVEKLKAFLESI